MPEEDPPKQMTLEHAGFIDNCRETSRDRGFLTENEREFILEEQELEGQQARNARYRIRQHAVEGLLDAALLNQYHEVDDIKQIAGNERISDFSLAIELIGLAYTFLFMNQDTPFSERDTVGDLDRLEDAVELALEQYHPWGTSESYLRRSVSVELDVTDFDLKDVEKRIRQGEATQNEMVNYYDIAMSEEDWGCDEEIVETIEPMLSNFETLAEASDEE